MDSQEADWRVLVSPLSHWLIRPSFQKAQHQRKRTSVAVSRGAGDSDRQERRGEEADRNPAPGPLTARALPGVQVSNTRKSHGLKSAQKQPSKPETRLTKQINSILDNMPVDFPGRMFDLGPHSSLSEMLLEALRYDKMEAMMPAWPLCS